MTIKDVAKKAGVSISTASYALNNRPNVNSKTREKILEVAESLGYYPNAHARNLKTRKSRNIGVFIYGFGGPIFSDLLEGINLELQKKDYNIIVSSGKASSIILRERGVDAAIIFDNNISDQEIMQYARNHPIVVLDRYLEGKNVFHSMIENQHLVYNFMSEIIEEKHFKKISYLSGPIDSFNNQERYKGFLQALEDKGLKEYQHIEGDFTISSGYKAGLELVSKNDFPDFIYCANDELAIGLIKAFNEKGVEIPKKISLAGFDGIALNEYITPKLTTIEINHFEWGRQIAGFLTKVLVNKNVYPLTNPEAQVKRRESV